MGLEVPCSICANAAPPAEDRGRITELAVFNTVVRQGHVPAARANMVTGCVQSRIIIILIIYYKAVEDMRGHTQ